VGTERPQSPELNPWMVIAQLREQLNEQRAIIEALSAKANKDICPAPPLLPQPATPHWRHGIPETAKGPKMNKPKEFSGKMEDTEVFSNSCMMYIAGQPNEFTNHQSVIMWVLSYMSEGSALEWRDEYLAEMSVNNWVLRHETLDAFFETIKEEFSDPDRQSTKAYKLHAMMQGDHPADEHVQSFKKAACGSSYSGFAHIEEFKCSLNNCLRERVSNLNNVPETIDRWYNQAMYLDRQW
jgi:hypothetical protein